LFTKASYAPLALSLHNNNNYNNNNNSNNSSNNYNNNCSIPPTLLLRTPYFVRHIRFLVASASSGYP